MKAFKDLTSKGQKIRIVKDAITQINAGILNPNNNGEYLIFGNNKARYNSPKVSLQKLFKEEKNLDCECCAKGALFASYIINVNKVSNKDRYNSEYFQKEKLKSWFSIGELDLIETAFEGIVINDDEGILKEGDCWTNLTKLGEKAYKFYKKYKDPKKRLLAILENILINKEFTL